MKLFDITLTIINYFGKIVDDDVNNFVTNDLYTPYMEAFR